MQIEVLRPIAFIALAMLPLVYMIHRRRPGPISPRLARLSASVRILMVGLLALALAEPQLRRPLDDLSVVYVVDTSDSIARWGMSGINDWLRSSTARMRPNDKVGLITFASDARVEQPLANRPLAGIATPQPDRRTEMGLATGLQLAGSLFRGPEMKRVVIISDGEGLSAKALVETRSLAARNVEVSVVPIRAQLPDPEVLIDPMEAPAKVREGEPYDVSVTVYSTLEVDAVLRLWMNGKLLSEEMVRLESGPNRFHYLQNNRTKGFYAYRSQVDSPLDTIPYNNEAQAYTVVGDRARVLIVEGSPGQSNPFAGLLNANSIDTEVIWDRSIPSSLGDLKKFDALVLHDVSATRLTTDQMQTIKQFVQSLGKGVLATGGKETFGLGGFTGTPLEEVLPATMTPPSRRENPSLALLLVIDKSGSMEVRARSDSRGNVTKMSMAKEAAILATEILDYNDQVAVVAFDMTPRLVVPWTGTGESGALDRVKDQINTLRADGGTEIFPALQLAYDQMRNRGAQVKHIVLLTDGRSFSSGNYDQLTQQMRQNNITLSTVAVGSDSDTQLTRRLAEQGGGQYYYTDEARSIPKIVTEETRRVSATREVEATFQPRVTWASPAIQNLVGSQLPVLHGYVVTAAKPSAQVVLASHADDPILAQWQTGLGRAMIWTPDVHADWGADWMHWSEAGRFWSQALRWVMPSPLDTDIQLQADVIGNQANLKIDILNPDGAFENLAETRATAVSYATGVPGIDRVDLSLRQAAPGRYEGSFYPKDIGTYRVEVVQLQNGAEVRKDEFGFVVPYPRDYAVPTTGSRALERLAKDGHGRVMRNASEVFTHDVRPQPFHSAPLWPWLAGLALILLPFDVALRRLLPGMGGRLFPGRNTAQFRR